MAYTKAPVNDTHNTIRVSSTGSPFLTSVAGFVQPTCKVVNGFPLTESQWGSDPKRSFHKRTGWKRQAVATGSVTTVGGLGCVAVITEDPITPYAYFGKSTGYHAFNLNANTVSATITTHPLGASTSVGAGTTFIDSTNARRVAFLSNKYLQSWTDPGLASITSTSLTTLALDGERGLVFINGYLFAVDETGQKIYNSGPAGDYTTWNATNFISAEQYGDPILWIEKHKNYLVAFGSKSIEFFYDGGVEVGSPLVRQESYACQIGLYASASTLMAGGRRVAKIGDDIYFMGVKASDSLALFRVRDFKVEEIGSQYAEGSFNYSSTGLILANTFFGLDTIVQDNNPMVLINLSGNDQLVYFPKEDTFVQFTTNTSAGYDIPDINLRVGGWVWHKYTGVVACIGQSSLNDSTMYMWNLDNNNSVSIEMNVYSDIVDHGINFTKHLARVDAVGDYGNNTLYLAYNKTPNYGESYTFTYTQNSSTMGYGNNVSWYNLGGFRRYSLLLRITGNYHSIHEGFDIEYNIGVA